MPLNSLSVYNNVILGIDPLAAKVAALIHFNGADGAAVTEQTGRVSMNASGVTASSATYVYGGSSGHFDGSHLISLTGVPVIGTQDYTVEFRMNVTTPGNDQMILDQRPYHTTGDYLCFFLTGAKLQLIDNEVTKLTSGTITAGWHAFCISRTGGRTYLLIDGALVGSYADTVNLTGNSMDIGANGWYGGTANQLIGYMDEFRLTIGVARHIAAYTLDTTEFPNP